MRRKEPGINVYNSTPSRTLGDESIYVHGPGHDSDETKPKKLDNDCPELKITDPITPTGAAEL